MNKPSRFYNIVRHQSGYVVIDQSGKHITPEDVWANAVKKLTLLVKADSQGLTLEGYSDKKTKK